ncbi:MAG: metallophosphoesterase [Anaerolineales bacterium]|nr:metallophosphoesterase [Anaerolineales bacterium]
MKIALTADLHLTTREEHPERYEALEDIFGQMKIAGAAILIIAGDLFQRDRANYADFDALCTAVSSDGLSVLVLPGNHDQQLHNRRFTSDNVEVIHEPRVIQLCEDSPPFLFLPYQPGSMGEAIAPFIEELPSGGWVLVAHGDYIETMREPNRIEPGIYMPLTARDLQEFSPRRTFLGHIHKPFDGHKLHYMGSPCSMDSTETGRRRFLIYDTETDSVKSRFVDRGPLYFLAELLCLPVADEIERLKQEIETAIQTWNLTPEEEPRVRVRLRLRGYTTDHRLVGREVKKALKKFSLAGEPDLSGLFSKEDLDRSRIADSVCKLVEALDWPESADEPSRADILDAALRTIYGD